MTEESNLQKEFLKTYDELADKIFRHVYFRVHDYELARDIVQETFQKAWQYMASGKQIENRAAFLYRIAQNLVISHYRKKKSESLEALMEKGFSPSEKFDEKYRLHFESQNMFRAIEELPEQYAEIIKMRYLEELSPKEIAAILGKSENAVSVSINRGIKKLKLLLK